MPDTIACPFCNFKTPYPSVGRVSECTGECYSTYTLVSRSEESLRTKMKLVEIFFVDEQYNPRMKPDEIDQKCEFRDIPAREPDDIIIFAREYRVVQEDIEKLKEEVLSAVPEIGGDDIERLHSALNRFQANLRVPGYPRDKLVNELRVVEKVVAGIREKLEETDPG